MIDDFETSDDIVARAWRGEACTEELCEEIKALRATVKRLRAVPYDTGPDGEPNGPDLGSFADLQDQLKEVICAWDALPGNNRYTMHTIETWLIQEMGPAITAAREEV